MRGSRKILLALLACALCAAQLHAQDKVAEGAYLFSSSGKPGPQKNQKHWTLISKKGGYRLESEILNQKEGIRVIQVEELNEQLVPSSIGYDLYLREHVEPDVRLVCSFSADSIVCNGKSEKGLAPASDPYRYKGPFLLAVTDLNRFDFAWLAAGALNMAHLTTGKVPLRSIHIAGGAALELTDDINVAALESALTRDKVHAFRPEQYIPWEFNANEGEEEVLEFAGTEDIQINGIAVPSMHYRLNTRSQIADFWLVEPGILVKAKAGSRIEYSLTDYKQYQKLIPGVKVETKLDAQPAKPK